MVISSVQFVSIGFRCCNEPRMVVALVDFPKIFCRHYVIILASFDIATRNIKLVGGLEHGFYFPILGIIPIDEVIFFRGAQYETAIVVEYGLTMFNPEK